MALLARLKKLVANTPVHEIDREVYYSDMLREQDQQPLRDLVVFLSQGLKEKGIDSAILAVGSSTFPKYYWRKHSMDPRGNYDDIDLRIVPAEITPVLTLQDTIGEILIANQYEWSAHATTTMGTTKTKSDDGHVAPFVHFAYGLHSITTELASGTKLDLILDYQEPENPLTAKAKIQMERENNAAFSLLYCPTDLK